MPSSTYGPSPRGRGNHPFPLDGMLCQRVHPRVGGETDLACRLIRRRLGPSPRGRGNPKAAVGAVVEIGSIPAWAGKPRPFRRWRQSIRVHPRVGGETRRVLRMRLSREGPSPRGRGNRVGDTDVPPYIRSIPAWAGKPRQGLSCRARGQVHPRVGGETPRLAESGEIGRGPSPRGRGNPSRYETEDIRSGSIPAWAGKPTPPQPVAPRGMVHPRVGGETTVTAPVLVKLEGPSPRGRGNQELFREMNVHEGSIPAWAGKPGDHEHAHVFQGVHPRVGGETR